MKKILLSLAMLLGFATFAGAETVKLVVNDATDVVGTKDGDNYVPVSSFKIGDYSFTFTYGEGTPSGSVPKLWLNNGAYQIRMFSQYENKMVMKAPEGVKMTKVLINDKANRDAGYTSPNGTVTFPKIENFTYTQWENAEGATECIIQTDGTKSKNCQYLDLEVTFEKEGGSASGNVALESVAEISPSAVYPAQMLWIGRGFISVDIAFEGGEAAVNKDCKESITMTFNGQPFGTPLSAADAYVDRWGEFTFEPGGELKNGEYVLTIPEGFFTYNGQPVAEYTDTYTISGIKDPVTFESVLENILPSDDKAAAEMWADGDITIQMLINGDIKMTYDVDGEGVDEAITLTHGDEKTRIWDYMAGEKLTITNPGGDVNPAADDVQKVVTLKFPVKAEAGEYELNIPSKFFTIGNEPLSAYTKSWTISASGNVTLESIAEIYPSAAASAQMMWISRDLISVDITFNEDGAAVNKDCKESITMTFNGQPFGTPLSAADADVDRWGEFTFEPGGELKNGEYVLTIPEGFFTYNGQPVAEYTDTYTISGIKEPVTFESVLENILPSDNKDAAEMWADGDITIQMLINGDIKMTYDVDGEGVDQPITLTHGDEETRIWDYMAEEKLTITNPGGDVNPAADDVQKVVTLKFPVKAEAGEYELNIPSKFFTIGDEPLSAYTKSWTIAAPEPVSFESLIISVLPDYAPDADKDDTAAEMWSNGQVMTQFILNDDVTVNSASTDKVTMTLNGEPFGIALDAASQYIQIMGGAEPLKTRAATTSLAMIFNPEADEEVLAPGEYTLNIPQGFFKAGSNLLTAYTCTWTVASQQAPAEVSFTFTPADGEVVTEELEDIFVNVTGAANVTLAADNNKIVLTKGEETIELVGIVFGQEIDYMILNPLSNGEWTATVPANSMVLDGTPYEEALTWKFTINESGTGQEEIKPVISPAEGKVNAEDLATITLTFPEDAVVVPAQEDMYMVMITPTKPTSGFSVAYTIDYEATKDNVIVLKYSGVIDEMVADTWTLNVGPNTYTVNGVPNAAFDVVYEVTSESVAGIFADADTINAYTVNGVAVILNGTADDLRQLPAGIYIINGVKVIIRK